MQIKYLVANNCIKPLCDLLTCSDVRIVTVALEGLENILKVNSTYILSPLLVYSISSSVDVCEHSRASIV